jgi:peptidyl-prolyl cis-trans isomerase SurA
MKQAIYLILFSLFITTSTSAKDNVLIKIGGRNFTFEEYQRIYNKNNSQLNDESEKKDPKAYLQLFIDYKLKVIEAEERGMDTLTSFINELAGYRDELTKPYLSDVTVYDSIVKQAYFRTVNEIRASHILLKLSPEATPEDSIKVYQKIIDIRNQFLNKEKTFDELAMEYSEDPSAKQNKGDLGYFKAFNMITAFENTAYQTKTGEISLPVRTQYGYHLIYVSDLLKSEGEIKVAHIMKMFPKQNDNSSSAAIKSKNLIDSIYQELLNGADFATMAKNYSDDKSTSRNGGEMNWISKSFRVKEFADAAFSLSKDNEIAAPIRTQYGWHIIKRIEARPPRSFEEMKIELTKKVKNDPIRSKYSKLAFINKLKKEYGFVAFPENVKTFKNFLNEYDGDTLKGSLPDTLKNTALYKVADSIFTVESFILLKENRHSKAIKVLNKNIDTYSTDVLSAYEDSRLTSKYPEFAQIMEEYHDGMLLFSIMQEEVWDKAIQDTLGLQDYYSKNNKNYFWDKHFSGLLIHCNNQAACDTCRMMIANGITDPLILKERINKNQKQNISVKNGKWEKGDNEKIDFLKFGGEKPEKFNPDFDIVHGQLIDAGVPKSLEDARGLYISDYQSELEKNWMKQLRNKYKIKVNKKQLKKVKSL